MLIIYKRLNWNILSHIDKFDIQLTVGPSATGYSSIVANVSVDTVDTNCNISLYKYVVIV